MTTKQDIKNFRSAGIDANNTPVFVFEIDGLEYWAYADLDMQPEEESQ